MLYKGGDTAAVGTQKANPAFLGFAGLWDGPQVGSGGLRTSQNHHSSSGNREGAGEEGCHGTLEHTGTFVTALWDLSSSLGCAEDAGGGKRFTGAP